MFLTIAPQNDFKENSTSTEDLLPCPRWGRGLLGCPYKGFLCPWSGVGQWLLSIAAAAAAEADGKWPFRAREKSCCCILLPQILSGVFFCHICETSVYISIIFCTCHPKTQKNLARLQLHSPFGAGMPGHSEASSFQAGAWDVRLSGRSD